MNTSTSEDVLIAGGGIGGLTLGLELHRLGVPFRIFESLPRVTQAGVGVTVLPHATRILDDLGLLDELRSRCVITAESVFYNRFGQFIYAEPSGERDGLRWPQLSIHRADLYEVLLSALLQRVEPDRVVFGACFDDFTQDEQSIRASFTPTGDDNGAEPFVIEGAVLIGADGIHSTLRKKLYPSEGEPLYQGLNMWRGVTRWPPFLTGASMLRVGWYPTGKLTIYPCRPTDQDGKQLMNWIAAIETPRYLDRDWGREGRLEDFIDIFADWHFDFLDVPAVFEAADAILEYPMVDQEPLDQWTFGRVTLLGDAAHPMVPRGSNGAGQAIVDCRSLADALASSLDPRAALLAYEAERRPATTKIVYTNRANPPDAILREVCERTNDQPFTNLDDVISPDELAALSEGYKLVTGYSRSTLG
jgi:2-polyprenyl-6-methoxyphenol hydroxylase-like FAD-dependent oxidoreductase